MHRRLPFGYRFPSVRVLLVVLLAGSATAAHADDPAAETAQRLQTVGAALLSWATDQVGSSVRAGAGVSPASCVVSIDADLGPLPVVDHADIESMLVPSYLPAVPERDAYGHPLEFRLAADLLGSELMSVRSPGADGLFEGTLYAGGFTAGPDDDQVWKDGFFVRVRPQHDPISLQARAVGEMLVMGSAALAWVTDQISASPAAFQGDLDLGGIDAISHADLMSRLVPSYTTCLPAVDPWGRPYDFFLDDNLLGTNVFAVRTAGADGVIEGNVYTPAAFLRTS